MERKKWKRLIGFAKPSFKAGFFICSDSILISFEGPYIRAKEKKRT